jgi:hypothetical protein
MQKVDFEALQRANQVMNQAVELEAMKESIIAQLQRIASEHAAATQGNPADTEKALMAVIDEGLITGPNGQRPAGVISSTGQHPSTTPEALAEKQADREAEERELDRLAAVESRVSSDEYTAR